MRSFPTLSLICMVCFPLLIQAQDKPAYALFDNQGNAVSFQEMANQLGEADLLFFGEQHNNPIAHWMQYELTNMLIGQKKKSIVLGAEMFEADNQLLINEYLKGIIREKDFEEEARLWKNYSTDYKPLISLALSHHLPFIATNIPRRYANLVYRNGLEGLEQLSAEAKSYLAPLPIEYDSELDCYKNMMTMMEGHGEPNPNFPKSQAIKDATMAHFIVQNIPPGSLFIHYNGAYHSDDHQGIVWYVERYRGGLTIRTITSVEQEDVSRLEDKNKGKADFILCVPASMTKTY